MLFAEATVPLAASLVGCTQRTTVNGVKKLNNFHLTQGL